MANKKINWHYYVWDDRHPGYVSTWHVGEGGRVIHGKDIRRETALRRGYLHECPFA